MCNREISSRRIDWSLPQSSTTIRGRLPGGSYQPSLHWRRWRNTENGRGLKGLSHLVQSCLLYRSCTSKDSARTTGHVDHFFPIKYCVACKKSTLKVLINLGFVTSFEDSHYILLFRYIYGAQLIQRFCYSKHLHVNRNYRPNGTAMSLSTKCYSANVPLDFCTTADFEMKYFFFNEGTAGALGNT